jgi:hypothetical protein
MYVLAVIDLRLFITIIPSPMGFGENTRRQIAWGIAVRLLNFTTCVRGLDSASTLSRYLKFLDCMAVFCFAIILRRGANINKRFESKWHQKRQGCQQPVEQREGRRYDTTGNASRSDARVMSSFAMHRPVTVWTPSFSSIASEHQATSTSMPCQMPSNFHRLQVLVSGTAILPLHCAAFK